MTKKIIPLGLTAVALLCALLSCGPDKDSIIRQEVDRRVAEYKARELETCRKNLYRRAEHMVDSLLLDEARKAVLDSANRIRPIRPIPPPPVPAIDTLKVRPLF